jgi:hypothetical protein
MYDGTTSGRPVMTGTIFSLAGNGCASYDDRYRHTICGKTTDGLTIQGHVGQGTAAPSDDALLVQQLTASETTNGKPFQSWQASDPTIKYDWSRVPGTGHLKLEGSQSCCVGLDFNGHILPTVDNQYQLGNNSFRWSLVRAVTVTPGDLILSDRVTGEELYKIHESPMEGIYFDDYRTGERLMRLDAQGNLHVKGKVIEGGVKTVKPRRKKGRRTRRSAAH